MRSVCLFGFLWGIATLASPASAEFVQLEKLASEAAAGITPHVRDKAVVVATRWAGPSPPWPVHEALGVELTSMLRSEGIDAVRAARNPATEPLSGKTAAFNNVDARRVRMANCEVLVAATLSARPKPRLHIELLLAGARGSGRVMVFDVPQAAFNLAANVPPLNRKVVEFCRGALGEMVGEGVCSTLAGEALAAAGADRPGVYTWGRELDAAEPILPGDILQLELAEIKGRGFYRNYAHHTAVVENVGPEGIVVLHQNVPPRGKLVQRELWPASAARSGIIQAFRPWRGDTLLQPVSPRRRHSPELVRHGSAIDLLSTLHPRLDSVHGIWFHDGGLKWNRETYARLQIPVTPPDRYVLKLRVRRLEGNDQFGIGLLVDGRQVLLAIDGYGGTKTGLHLLDGQKSRDNASTYDGQVLPADTYVNLTVQVRPDAVRLLADDKTIVDWSGDSAQLSMDDNYAVPNKDWLFLTSWNTQCEIVAFLLEPEL